MPLVAVTSAASIFHPTTRTLLPLHRLPNSRSFRSIGSHPPSQQLALQRRVRARVHQVQEGQCVASESQFPHWEDFASCVSGEWDGYGAEFSHDGKPVELPESVVPEAFREWGVEVFDWQTQCPTLAESGRPTLTYKLIKLLPTVGCEADAATRYSTEERVIDGVNSGTSVFVYDRGGSYFALWNSKEKDGVKILELEHCLVDPRERETRIRIVQFIQLEETILKLQKIMVFSENWYGPFRNGEQLGGCAIRESGFAATGALKKSEIEGLWQGTRISASFDKLGQNIICEMVTDTPEKLSRDGEGLVTLPKNLWCSLRGGKNGETWAEVGWLLHQGRAMTSRCIFSDDGSLKAVVMAQEAAVLEDI